MVYNIYTFLSVVAVCIVIIIVIYVIVKYNRSISISKDGVTINTKDGNYILKEIVDKENTENESKTAKEKTELIEITTRISNIKNSRALAEQMNYIERELSVYYKNNIELLSEILDNETVSVYKLVFEIHKIKMLTIMKQILKENHLTERVDWQAYKERQRIFTWEVAREKMEEIFNTIKYDRKEKLLVPFRDKIASLYQLRFYGWMDEFKRISIETNEELVNLKNMQFKLLNSCRGK